MSIQAFDTQILLLINNGAANRLFDILMPALSAHGYLLILPFLLALLLKGTMQKIRKGTPYLTTAVWTILIAVCALFLSEWVEDLVKAAVGRIRPCRAIEGIRLLIACPKSFSLPSGHAITSFAVALPLFHLTRGHIPLFWRLYPVILAALIAFSRLYLGVHYPTDVLAGALAGSCIGLGLSYLYQIIVNGIQKKTRQEK